MKSKDDNAAPSHDERPSGQYSSPAVDPSSRLLGLPGVWEATLDEAQAGSVHEHNLTVRDALKSYPWALFWSLLVSMSVIMEGYDTILVRFCG